MTEPKPFNTFAPELLAPAGNWDAAKAAVENGADAIYFGLDRFNARMRADNFTLADLPELMTFLHCRGVKGYVALNTLIFPEELAAVEADVRQVIRAGVDAVIVQDIGLCRLIRHLSPDFPIHASTQMTITSAAGVGFAQALGCQLVVLARECSLAEIAKIQQQTATQGTQLPLEVFVHGALCVAYSGQCLTSEALGGRSANRGECAQACRMPYELVVDGQVLDLGERQYLLSPQDLSGLEVLPDLLRTGLACFKIEGRLKSPEYVANVTRVYRQAIDRCLSAQSAELLQHQADSRYRLEMAFSRGLYTGWFRGIDNQALVHGRFGKKRGVYLGQVTGVDRDRQRLLLQPEAPLKPGDGVVFDQGHPDRAEEGGRIYGVEETEWGTVLWFGKGDLNWRRLQVGDRVWKTSDPELERELRQSFAGDQPRFARSLQVEVAGQVGEPLRVTAEDEQGHQVAVESEMLLVKAERQPLTTERLREQLGRLGNTPFYLAELLNHLQGEVLIPVRELNRLRREMVVQLEALRTVPRGWTLRFSCEDAARTSVSYRDLLPTEISNVAIGSPELIVLVRNLAQLEAVLDLNIATIYCEFEDPRRYREAVERVRRDRSPLKPLSVWVAPPRITKPGEQWILEQVQKAGADGYLIRNYDHLDFFAKGTSPLDKRCRGDFSLNVANGLTAAYFKEQFGLERLTVSYDLNRAQLEGLLRQAPPDWFEVTIHQHMPLFHMEHCVFCAFLSTGQDYRNCGRPCEQYGVKLRDGLRPAFGHRTHTEHLLQADAGCRNTVFNGRAQTGAEAVQGLLRLGLRHFRVEFLQETPDQVRETTRAYQALLAGEMTGTELWQQLKLQSQLGVTRGSFEG